MRLNWSLLALGLVSSTALSAIVTVTTTDSTTTTTQWVTESLLVVTVYDSTPSTTILRRHSANTETTEDQEEETSSFNTSLSATSTDAPTVTGTIATTVAFTPSSTLTPSSKIDPKSPVATLHSSAETSTSTIFSETASSSVPVWTGTIISTIETKSLPTQTVETKSSSLTNTIDTSTLTDVVTVTTPSASRTSSPTSSAPLLLSSSSLLSSSDATSFADHVSLSSSLPSLTAITTIITTTTYGPSSLLSTMTTLITTSTPLTSSISSTTSTSITTSTSSSSTTSTTSTTPSASTIDLFEVIDTNSPPSVFPREELYLEILSGVENDDTPYQTNKFYVNLMMNNQDQPVFSYPFSFFYVTSSYFGIAMSHTLQSSQTFGYSSSDSSNADYYSNPILVGSLIFSATTLTSSNINLELTDMEAMSALVTLSDGTDSNYIDIPLVEGMGMGSAVYNGALVPEINSQVGISTFSKETSTAIAEGILKYRVTLYNNVDWLLYVTLPDGFTEDDFEFTVSDPYSIVGSSAIDGLIIQAAPAPDSDLDGYYDEAAGMYPLTCEVQGTADSNSATYKFVYTTEGLSASGNIIVFAFQHHIDSLSSSTSSAATGISLYSPTMGHMFGFLSNELVMIETLNADVSFLPYAEVMSSSSLSYTAAQLQLIADVVNSELSVDIASLVSGQSSNYYSGKVIDKYAQILLVVSDIIGDEDVTASTLAALKSAFETFTNNGQYYPLIYDTRYGGVTSSAGQSGDSEADFGSAHYNDHHFHYGYFIHAAAVVGYIDAKQGGSWAEDNKDWVNSLIRDVANPSSDDTYFPVSRMFDWFHGHSWASGLTAAGDGLNQESSSEDYHCYYGMKLWGSVIGDQSMENRGDLMLSVMKRSMNLNYYYHDDNTVQPSEFIGNKVAGILFQNKIAYTTYFGTNTEYIHGIHMLPITAASGMIREESFVKEEWNEKLSSIINSVSSGWTGILRLNQALFDPSSSYEFFAADDFSDSYLDNGQSRAWSLAFAAGVLNSS